MPTAFPHPISLEENKEQNSLRKIPIHPPNTPLNDEITSVPLPKK